MGIKVDVNGLKWGNNLDVKLMSSQRPKLNPGRLNGRGTILTADEHGEIIFFGNPLINQPGFLSYLW